jgi:hypothetical protein
MTENQRQEIAPAQKNKLLLRDSVMLLVSGPAIFVAAFLANLPSIVVTGDEVMPPGYSQSAVIVESLIFGTIIGLPLVYFSLIAGYVLFWMISAIYSALRPLPAVESENLPSMARDLCLIGVEGLTVVTIYCLFMSLQDVRNPSGEQIQSGYDAAAQVLPTLTRDLLYGLPLVLAILGLVYFTVKWVARRKA